MFGPWLEIYTWLRNLLPESFKLKRPRFNVSFIFLHYSYMVGLTIVGSIILYPAGNMQYVDALFFASGAATQSGLNTININLLQTYQQVTFMIIACIANPIFINTFVVFVRLYWFEKRFQSVVLEAARFRRTRERQRTMSRAKEEPDPDMQERGVAGRNILVVRPGQDTIEQCQEMEEQNYAGDKKETDSSNSEDADSGKGSQADGQDQPKPKQDREIAFADEAPAKETDDEERLPEQRSTEQHIRFLEKQRNPKDDTVLYIPGPRDFDRGQLPQEIDASGAALSRKKTGDTPMSPYSPGGAGRRFNFENLPGRIAKSLSFEGGLSKAKEKIMSLGQDAEKEGDSNRYAASDKGDAERPASLRRTGRMRTFQSFVTNRSDKDGPEDATPYLSYQPTVGRNSAFVNLTEDQREELGGIEYRALKSLVLLLCCFYIGFHLFGFFTFVPWILHTSYAAAVTKVGISRTWWGFFTAASHFTDLGFTLTPTSMEPFREAVFPLLLGSFLIIIGNTGFPCMLRFVIWIVHKLVPKESTFWEEYRFLLDHPRRCFTLLFPSKATWWLFWVLVMLNGIDLIFYIILDLNDPAVTVVPPGDRVLDGWYQAASTRTAGFAVVNLSALHPGIQVSYLIMMYISVFPVAISVRRTNVYEEKSLGIWGDDRPEQGGGDPSYVGAHLRRQLSFDLWFIFLGMFIIACVEGDRIQNRNDYAFTLFSVLFEIVSAYGTVGLSLGYPGTDTSFSAQFRTASKLVIIAMQIRGRHRGLPYALDKAILLPSEGLQRKEHEDATMRMQRRLSTSSRRPGAGAGPGDDDDAGTPDGEDVAPRHSPSVTRQTMQVAPDPAQLSKQATATTAASTATSAGPDAQRRRGGLTRLLSAGLSAGPSSTLQRFKRDHPGPASRLHGARDG